LSERLGNTTRNSKLDVPWEVQVVLQEAMATKIITTKTLVAVPVA